jgi:hypothetical protein
VQRTWKEFLPSLDQDRIDSNRERERERERERATRLTPKRAARVAALTCELWQVWCSVTLSVIPPLQRIQDFSGGKTRVRWENGSRQRGINNTGMLTIAVVSEGHLCCIYPMYSGKKKKCGVLQTSLMGKVGIAGAHRNM